MNQTELQSSASELEIEMPDELGPPRIRRRLVELALRDLRGARFRLVAKLSPDAAPGKANPIVRQSPFPGKLDPGLELPMHAFCLTGSGWLPPIASSRGRVRH